MQASSSPQHESGLGVLNTQFKKCKRESGVPSFYYTLAAAGQLGFDVDERATKQKQVGKRDMCSNVEIGYWLGIC